MKKITEEETLISGKWLYVGGEVRKDENSLRIEWLIQNHLKWISKDETGWLNLYLDPLDGRYWELFYEDSDFHGGGPPSLRCLPKETAKERYRLS